MDRVVEMTPTAQAQYRRQMKPYRKTAHTMAVQMDTAFVIRQEDPTNGAITGTQYCNAGDYLAVSAGGGVYGIPKKTFEDSYESVG